MSSLQRPAKRLRSSPGSKPTLFQSNSTVPILLRHQDPDIAVIKCLEAISTERLLRQCDLIDKVIAENFWDKTEPQNRNRTNVREAKVYICRLIGPILYQLITQYIDSLEHADLESPLPPSPPAVQHNAPHPQHSGPVGTADGASAGLEEAFRAVPPALPAAPAVPAALSHAAPIGVGTWLATNNAFPFRQNLEIIQQSSTLQRLNPAPAQEFYNVQELRFPEAVHGQTVTEPSNQENAPASNASPAQARTTVQPEPSVSELTNAITDRQETRSVVSVVRNKHRSGTYTPCSFCSKPLPSPSARR
ncbi:hypothetical protein DRE_00950 [Drechslerella stenobrocha 248]|uniref:Uncharacterized protein n=1 Tax=Drechslerella stenobrocha 248 TaxID=1043628 RepID=W7HLK8_9PEZI|nr:hypothetical protein DRE_00950 [Drechslerella stenobrocha 248]